MVCVTVCVCVYVSYHHGCDTRDIDGHTAFTVSIVWYRSVFEWIAYCKQNATVTMLSLHLLSYCDNSQVCMRTAIHKKPYYSYTLNMAVGREGVVRVT